MITIKITQGDMSVDLNISEDIFKTGKNKEKIEISTDGENQIDFDKKVKKVCISGLNVEGLLNNKSLRKRKQKSLIKLSREDWQIILDDLHNGRRVIKEIVKEFGVGQSTVSVKYKSYRENNLIVI